MLRFLSRHRLLTLGAGIFFSLAILAAVSFFIPLVSEVCGKNEYTNEKECASYHIAPAVFWYVVAATNNYGGAITALATVAIACFTLTLWRATTQQVILTEDIAKIYKRQTRILKKQTRISFDQHATARQTFVAMHHAALRARKFKISKMQAGEKFSIEFEIVNKGATEAYLSGIAVYTQITTGIGEWEIPPIHIPVGPFPDGPHHLAGGSGMVHAKGFDWTVSPDEIDRLKGGMAYLHIIGRVTYKDENGVSREIGFFRYFDFQTRRFHKINDPDYQYEE